MLVEIVSIGQEPDGYLTTWRTINPAKPTAKWVKVKEGKRWESLEMSHELYNAGHLYEAAVVHYKATGKRNFLDIALKNADLIVKVFGDGDGQIQAVPGHQIIETGLLKLYEVTGNEEYLKQAKYFLDNRGGNGFGPYAQDHKPVVEQDEVVGHAVRAVYMYAAMTDISAIYQDSAYRKATDDLWSNMVNKKMYLTGGIGALHAGEAFGENYHLPNLTAYNETCAAIGSVYWNHRLFSLTGQVQYQDVMERTLYNAVIPGLSLDGTKFFYPNPLESDAQYQFNQGATTRKHWFDCSCCPTNLIRFLPSVSGLIYARQKDTIYVNQLIGNTAEIQLENNTVNVEVESGFPWNGLVNIKVRPDHPQTFTVKVRVPGWSRNDVSPGDLYSYNGDFRGNRKVTLNGGRWELNGVSNDGYLAFTREWKADSEISVDLPMEVRQVRANEKVKEDSGKVALEYGPLVYAFEEVDNADALDEMSVDSVYSVSWRPELLEGVNTLVSTDGNVAVPYYAWSNRGIGKMKVWINEAKD